MGSTTLFKAVFLNPEQVVHFYACTCSGLLKTALNNVLLPTLFNVVNNVVQHCWAWISLQSGVTMLNNIVDNINSKTLFNAVFNCPEQVVWFLLCRGQCLSRSQTPPWWTWYNLHYMNSLSTIYGKTINYGMTSVWQEASAEESESKKICAHALDRILSWIPGIIYTRPTYGTPFRTKDKSVGESEFLSVENRTKVLKNQNSFRDSDKSVRE